MWGGDSWGFLQTQLKSFVLSEVDTRSKKRKCLHFLTLGVWTPPPPSPRDPQPRRPVRSERGREGTMS